MNSVLITGGSGYIGSRLIRILLAEGVAVRATARTPTAAAALATHGAEPVPWSLEDQEIPSTLLDGVDTVFHLAAPRRVYDAAARRTGRPGDQSLAEGSARLAAAVVASDVKRMIVSSSAKVYGNHWVEVDETATVRPLDAYGKARLDAERSCQVAFRETPTRLAIARLTETFGPGSPGQLGLLNQIAEGRFRLIGTGWVMHHMSTVEDAVAGLLALARTDGAGGAVLNIGSRPRTLRSFVEAASEELGQPVRATPWAGPPARALLRLLRSASPVASTAPALHAVLDYQLRPRAFSIQRSLALHGTYAQSDFNACVATAARAAREAG